MVTTFFFSALFLAISGILLARKPVLAKLRPLLRSAR